MTEQAPPRTLNRALWQRVFGIPATKRPADPGCFEIGDDRLTVDLDRAPELTEPGGAIRLEGGDLKHRILVVHGDDGRYHAFKNRCMHMGRRLDPVPGSHTVQCCSVGKATYDYEGNLVSGSAQGPIEVLPVTVDGRKLVIAGGR